MTEDLSRFSDTVKVCMTKWAQDKTQQEVIEGIGSLAVAFNVPIVIVCLWMGELLSWPEEIKTKYDSLYKFYKYDKIYNMPEGCKW